ncbi:MAG TPA: hypothetical protein VFI72_10785, partial [Candidatus Angelobacter sp.]|nr:hypothetical protein [Candidatus Angelobacter sp.]
GPAGIGWLFAFIATAVQALSPSSVRHFFAELDLKDRMLARFAWLLVLSVPLFAIAGVLNPPAANAVNAWIKPIKFAVSFATFVWTVTLFLQVLVIPAWQRQLARYTMLGSVIVEMLSLAAQAWRASAMHPSAIDFWITQATTAMVSVNTCLTIWLLGVFFGGRDRINIGDAAQVMAIRLSIIIFLLGNAIGGYMLARGAHTVGATDGGPGLPFVNWSVIAGDLRIAHFIAIHAIQLLPLFAWLLWQMGPRPSSKARRIAVYVAAMALTIVVGGTFVQAALGHPLIALAR